MDPPAKTYSEDGSDDTYHTATTTDNDSDGGIVLYPNQNDVLIGSGKQYQDFPGNIRYRQLIESNCLRYNESNDRYWKMSVTIDVVRSIQESNGRFLSRVDGIGWKVVDDEVARGKTGAAFRSKKSYLKFKNIQQQQQRQR